MINRRFLTSNLNCGGTVNLLEGYYSGGKVIANIAKGATALVNGTKLTGTGNILILEVQHLQFIIYNVLLNNKKERIFMPISKMSSQDFNDLIGNIKNKIDNVNNDIYKIKNNMDSKSKVIKYSLDYIYSCIKDLENSKQQDGEYIVMNGTYKGLYETYGDCIHTSFKSQPINLFNVIPINSENIFYNDEAFVAVNGIKNDSYKNLLKADTVSDKQIFFEEFAVNKKIEEDTNGTSYLLDDNKIVISITLNKEKTYGISKFNIIEIDPYLSRSFDIQSISIYDTSDNVPSLTLNNISSVEKERIILDKKYLFNKVEITILPKYKSHIDSEEIIPFGLKHIFFYDADFRNDSFIEIPFFSEKYIDYIEDKVILYTPQGQIETTLSEQNIKIYLDNINGILTTEQEPTNNIRKTIARNVNEIYFKVPIGTNKDLVTYNNSVYAIRFFIKYR